LRCDIAAGRRASGWKRVRDREVRAREPLRSREASIAEEKAVAKLPHSKVFVRASESSSARG
jgi:hypothetical protein